MSIKPGPELDRLVGEKLGFEVITEKEDVQRRQQTENERATIALYGDHYVLRRKGLPSVTWAPSTASMQLVVEEIERRNFEWSIQGNRAAVWNDEEGIDEDVQGESPPHALCLAVLAALSALEGQADD